MLEAPQRQLPSLRASRGRCGSVTSGLKVQADGGMGTGTVQSRSSLRAAAAMVWLVGRCAAQSAG